MVTIRLYETCRRINCAMSRVKDHREEEAGGKDKATSSEILRRIPPHLKKGLDGLRKHETQILDHINSSPEAASRFLSDPMATLTELGIQTDTQLASSLKLSSGGANNFISQRTFHLPNGKEIRPKITVTFVRHADG